MGYISTEQTTEIIDSVTELVDAVNTEPVMRAEPNMNFWPLLALAVIPVLLGYWLNNRRKRKG